MAQTGFKWISTNGTDTTTDASSYASAAKTLWGLKALTGVTTAVTHGDTIYVVNDGTHAMTGLLSTSWLFDGTDYTTDPGLVITGATSNATPTMTTIAATGSTNKLWFKANHLANYITLQGLSFDYSALRQVSTGSMYPVELTGQVQNVRLLDCEIVFVETNGATVTNSSVPRIPQFSGASAAHGGAEIEVARCVSLGGTIYAPAILNGIINYHHNVVVIDGDGIASNAPAFTMLGAPTAPRKFYKNTVFMRSYDTDYAHSIFNANADQTAELFEHSNLIYADCGTNVVSVGMSGNLLDGYSLATQTVSNTVGYDFIALGPSITPYRSTWTTTVPGLSSYEFNETWRGGATGSGSEVPTSTTDLVTNQTVQQVFNSTTASWTWTPDVFDHTLPWDMRPLQGVATAFDGAYAGAIPPVSFPTAVADAYTVPLGSTLIVNQPGILGNDTESGGLTITVTEATNVATGTLSVSSDGGFTYTSSATYVGSVAFNYRAKNSEDVVSNLTTVTITYDASVIPPDPDDGDITYEGIIDSLPFYRDVFRADTISMLQVRRNDNFYHSDVRHYVKDELHDESTSRVVEVPPTSGRVAITLGGVSQTQGVILESDQTVAVSFMWHNGTTNVTFTAEVDGVAQIDKVPVTSIVVNNTASTTATVLVAVFD
jgi:hypothetical protein